MMPMERKTSRFRYGDTSLWVIHRGLEGSRAKRLSEHVELHFREKGTPLVLDLRRASFVDTLGAEVLEMAKRRHAGLAVVGKPRDFEVLAPATKAAISSLRPSGGIGEALSSLTGAARFPDNWDKRRKHTRFPVEIEVEIFLGTLCAAATLRDLSSGGTRISRLPTRWLHEIKANGEAPVISIAGLEEDPLGREIAAAHSRLFLTTKPVHLLPDHGGLGVRFTDPAPGDMS